MRIKYNLQLITIILLTFISCNLDNRNDKNNKHSNKIVNDNIVSCKSEEKINPESSEDPILINTCSWGKYKSITTGLPDYKGRYSFEYQLYILDNGQAKPIKNDDIFNNKVKQLEQKINAQLKKEFDMNSKDPELSECFEATKFNNYSINEMGITFKDNNQIEFNVNYELGGACFSVNNGSVTFKLTELKDYFK